MKLFSLTVPPIAIAATLIAVLSAKRLPIQLLFTWFAIAMVVSLPLLVFLHELAHVVAAASYGAGLSAVTFSMSPWPRASVRFNGLASLPAYSRALIAAAGIVLESTLLLLLALLSILNVVKDPASEALMLLLLISFVANISPFTMSDGALIKAALADVGLSQSSRPRDQRRLILTRCMHQALFCAAIAVISLLCLRHLDA